MTDTDVSRPRSAALAALAIALLTAVFYAPTAGYGYIRYDDPNYVFLNPEVSKGLTLDTVRWSLTAFQVGNWHPLTLLSHMLDVNLFGDWAGGHHLTSAWLHAANAALLFLFLRAATGRAGRSAAVAVLFAVHPLQVESVAWISQRKSVLSTCCMLLALLAYVAWTRHGGWARYASSLAAFALGLASKPMVMTLPALLLAVDFWPLGRWPSRSAPGRWRVVGRLAAEKAPFAALAVSAAAVTVWAQAESGAVGTLEAFPWGARVARALVAYGWYPVKMAWPSGLSLFYPLSLGPFAAWKVGGSLALLAAASAAAVALRRSRPYLIFGWTWYMVALFPVAGLVQFGTQIVADRYAYVPGVGLLVAAVWGIADGVAGRAAMPRRAGVVLVLAAATAYAVATTAVLAPWRDSVTLLSRGVRIAPDNPHALVNLGLEFVERGEFDAGIDLLRRAEDIVPLYRPLQVNLGYAYAKRGEMEKAREHYEAALALRGGDAKLETELGRVLTQLGRSEEGEQRLAAAVRLDPALATAHLLLGTLLHAEKRWAEAEPVLERAVALAPDDARARTALGVNLDALGRRDEAIRELREAVRLDPSFERARTELTRVLGVKS